MAGAAPTAGRMLSVVHPQAFVIRLQEAYRRLQALDSLAATLAEGGTFTVATQADGSLSITRNS